MPTDAEIIRNPDYNRASSIYEFSVKCIHGEIVKLDQYEGNVCLITNVATKNKCSEPCFKLLNELYQKYWYRGLKILAFPCNQFNNTEPGTSEDIMQYMKEHNIKFTMFEKVEVNGEEATPLWRYLKYALGNENKKGSIVKNDFEKFLCPKSGVPKVRFGFEAKYEEIDTAVERYLDS